MRVFAHHRSGIFWGPTLIFCSLLGGIVTTSVWAADTDEASGLEDVVEPDGPKALAADPSSEEDAERPKDYREGLGFAGLPLANYNSDDGFGYGVKVAGYDYGKNKKPYKTQLSLQLFFTTRKVNYHRLRFDAPNFLGSPWRVDSALKWDRVLLSNYYGIGNDTSTPTTESVGITSDLSDEEAQAQIDRVNYYYTSYQSLVPSFILNLRRDLNGPLKLFNGYQLKYTIVKPHTSATLSDYAGITVDEGWSSFLEQEKPYGYGGGASGFAQFGVVYDSRDQEPSPDHGFFSDASLRVAYNYALDDVERQENAPLYAGLNLTNRYFLYIARDLVFATRVVGDFLIGDVPFYELTSFGGIQDYTGLGGDVSMRGVKSRRYRGKVKVLATPELRYMPVEVYKWNQKFNLAFVAFADVGRVWADYVPDGAFGSIHYGVGGGLRIAWNDNFLIRLDIGKDLETNDLGFYLTFDHAF